MTDVLVERYFDTPLAPGDVQAMVDRGAGCLDEWNVAWVSSYLATDGQRMICHFKAVDAESVRMVFRQAGQEEAIVWPVTVHDMCRDLPRCVLVERHFEVPTPVQVLQEKEDASAWCLDKYEVRFLITYHSLDEQRMVCCYHAPDAESVRQAQREADMPFDKVWACRHVQPR